MKILEKIKLLISNKVLSLFINNKNPQKMGKNKEELKEKMTAAKEELKAAKEERRAFEKENKLAKGEDHSGNKDFGKKWAKINETVKSKQEKVDKIQGDLDEVKAATASSRTTYTYPDDVKTAADKKKFRAKARAAKKRAEKGEAEPKAEKSSKKDKSEKSEKSGKKKKEKVAAEEED
jgi:hypothetical protein